MYVKFSGTCLKQDKIKFNHLKNNQHIHCL